MQRGRPRPTRKTGRLRQQQVCCCSDIGEGVGAYVQVLTPEERHPYALLEVTLGLAAANHRVLYVFSQAVPTRPLCIRMQRARRPTKHVPSAKHDAGGKATGGGAQAGQAVAAAAGPGPLAPGVGEEVLCVENAKPFQEAFHFTAIAGGWPVKAGVGRGLSCGPCSPSFGGPRTCLAALGEPSTCKALPLSPWSSCGHTSHLPKHPCLPSASTNCCTNH